ncbi:RIP metalloprotease RseP [Exiguobacterium oxidotolerans]|uniref:Zinc metalloprotease n=1 Tax=Exiguobacterium oxidotolerans TaxID=223958 RepID=A0A653ICL9_9BACL|nr:RIP metalloprotease RseP [Exiguobacterium oxidotolerans]VWX36905.1 inner membrane zinc metalloprotease required for the extracytoplasmic stress response mediated by sigma(W) [Exiguobacterium oxidotolerans]
MTTFISIVLMFGVLVAVHEWGHLVMAKRAGILCREFAIGFGPKIFSFFKNETLYTVRLLPIGGYVKMAGEEPEFVEVKPGQAVGLGMNEGLVDTIYLDASHPKADQVVTVERIDLLHKLELVGLQDEVSTRYDISKTAFLVEGQTRTQIAPYDRTFGSKSVFKRVLAIAAGPAMNFVLAFIILFGLALYNGSPTGESVIGTVQKGSPADQAGLVEGDRIVSVNGDETTKWEDLRAGFQDEAGKETTVVYERDGQETTTQITPKIQQQGDQKVGIIGVTNETEKSFGTALETGVTETWRMSTLIVGAVGDLVTGVVGVDQLSGPVGIVKMTDQVADSGFSMLLTWTALLSVNLAVFNLLPLPALDGGRLLFLFLEALRGKPVDPQKEGLVHFVGFALLMLLMLVVTWNDIQKFF